MPPKPGGLNCANADKPGATTNAAVTAASSIPLRRMLMTIPPKIGNCTVPIGWIVLPVCKLGHGGGTALEKGPAEVSQYPTSDTGPYSPQKGPGPLKRAAAAKKEPPRASHSRRLDVPGHHGAGG